jgi:membrane protease YdiL (CAAX protease family)
MRRRAVRLWAALALEAAVAVAAVASGLVPVSASVRAVAIGVAVGALLFGVLGARLPALAGVPPRRLPPLAAKSGVLVAKSAGEEVLWRGLALGSLAGAFGIPAAAAASTAGFALAHARPLGRRGVAVHLATGAAFAGVCVAVSLAAAVAAHCAYNVLVAVALERERHRA